MKRLLRIVAIAIGVPSAMFAADFGVTSPAFADGGAIPAKFARGGGNASPPLVIAGVPGGAKSLAIEMIDPDAPGGDWVHWLVANVPAAAASLDAGRLPAGGVVGANDWGVARYDGPQPPSGTHRYVIRVFALDSTLALDPGFTRAQLERAMSGHVLARAELIGTFAH